MSKNEPRSTCIICKKKRYRKSLIQLPFLKFNVAYAENVNVWMCKGECSLEYVFNLSELYVQLKRNINEVQKIVLK